MESNDRLRRARIDAGFKGPVEAARRFGWSVDTYKSNENGNAPFSMKKARDYASAFGVEAQWLYDGSGPMRPQLVQVIGKVGADPEGRVFYSTGQGTDTMGPRPSRRQA
jgi:transcriptional regulator with XRE-family HTH domain